MRAPLHDLRDPRRCRAASELAPAPAGPAVPLPDLEGLRRLQVVCLPAVHHVLEYRQLYGWLERIRDAHPGLRVELWLRSALESWAPFHRLPAARLARLPDRPRGPVLRDLRSGGRPRRCATLQLGRHPDWDGPLREVGGRLLGPYPFDFETDPSPPGGESDACRQACDAFYDALTRAAPRWVGPGSRAMPWRLETERPGFLVHQSRFHLGDALWLTPVLDALGRLYPAARITVLGGPALGRALARRPGREEILVFDPEGGPRERLRVLDALAGRPIDAALLGWARRPKSRWLAEALAERGVEHRVNLEYFHDAGDGRDASPLFTAEGWFFWGTLSSPRLLTWWLYPFVEGVEEPWNPRRSVSFPIEPEARRQAAEALAALGFGEGRFAVLAPGGFSSERWPAERFAALARLLADELGLHVVVEGGPGEEALLAAVEASLPPASGGSERRVAFASHPLPVLAALLERTALLVGNDSAPIHLAEAVGAPTLYLAQEEKLVHSHPAGEACWALYDDGSNRVSRITVEQAVAAVAEMARRGLLRSWEATRPTLGGP